MKTERNILIAFILNLGFSIFEFVGGAMTNSVAIISDSIHDIGDAMSIGLSYFLEKKSKKSPDEKYTYGYIRYSVIGSLITSMLLIISSILVAYTSIKRIFSPVDINYNGMIVFAIIGIIVNYFAAYFTKGGHSLNQKSVNLHMLEDILGWLIVLIGAIIMRFSSINIIDSILSILVSLFIFKQAIMNFRLVLDLFLDKIPSGISVSEIKNNILKINGVKDVHHIHVWSIDGCNNYATMHVVVEEEISGIKELVKKEMAHSGINHTTIEVENENEKCKDKTCKIKFEEHHHHH